MLIKKSDDRSEELTQLSRLAEGAGETARRAVKDLAIRKAGVKGEVESAYQIDFHYAASPNWMVIHDLRLESNERVAQIDHVLINRWMECYVLESKHFNAGLKITEDGEFLRWNDYKRSFEGMPSPLLQNDRHIAVLRDVMATLDLPTRLGLRINFAFQSFVLVSSKARIDRPQKFDSNRVIKADQIKERIWRDIEKESALIGLARVAKIVSADTVRHVAEQLANLHRPLPWTLPGLTEQASGPSAPETQTSSNAVAKPAPIVNQATKAAASLVPETPSSGGPQCKGCRGIEGDILYGKYGYYFQCAKCSINTAIKFTCLTAHRPRLRKAGIEFYRDCAECNSAELYFTNG